MDPLLAARITALETKIEENTALLVKMHKSQQRAAYVRMAYWAIILFLTFGSLVAIKPYIQQLTSVYSVGSGAMPTTSSLTDYGGILKQLQDFKASQDQ